MIGSDAHVTVIESKVQWLYYKVLVERLNVDLLARHFNLQKQEVGNISLNLLIRI